MERDLETSYKALIRVSERYDDGKNKGNDSRERG